MMAENIWDFYHLFNPDEVLLNDDLKKYNVEIEQNEINIKDLQNRLDHNDVNYTDALYSMLTKMLEKTENDEIDLGVTSTQLPVLFWMRRTCCNNRCA
jgi:hypothetical protein